MANLLTDLDTKDAVNYHYDRFPPIITDFSRIIRPLSRAAASLARYDQMLKNMHSSDLLLAPLRSQEAVVSSRMEGTVSTLDEVLRYEADQEDADAAEIGTYRGEAVEVFLYSHAMRQAQSSIKAGVPLSTWIVRAAHKQLLDFGRGADMSPGEFKTQPNYLADRSKRKVLFVPISPERLQDGLDQLFDFINNEDWEPLLKVAIAHLEFEALHPFKDGNGRIGRMLIPLMLWKFGVISEPHFYISTFFEEHKDAYIDNMRNVSASDDWPTWIVFFLEALESEANANLAKAEKIRDLYEDMKGRFRNLLSSQWSTTALDFIFTRPIFRNTAFTSRSGIPAPTAHRFARILAESGLLTTIVASSGRRAALYAFEPLLELVRG